MTDDYYYPASEAITDKFERSMDPYKLRREALAIELLLQFNWNSALDYGCGVGRYFHLFDRTASHERMDRSLLGIEPDQSRFEQALELSKKLSDNGSLPIQVRNGATEALEEYHGKKFDFILCSQILGHVTRKSCEEIIEVLSGALSDRGCLVFLVPFATTQQLERVKQKQSVAADDYYHLVNFERSPFDEDYRIPLTPQEFDRAVIDPRPSILPVRAFGVNDIPIKELSECPFPLGSIPKAFMALKNSMDYFLFVYTVHVFERYGGGALIGDVIMRFSPNDRRKNAFTPSPRARR